MIRQFLREPGEFLTFGQLAFRIPGADKEVLHLVADSRPDLFAVARNDKALKLHTNAVQKILRDGIVAAATQPEPAPAATTAREGIRCGHFSQEELLADVHRCSLPPKHSQGIAVGPKSVEFAPYANPIDAESRREICVTRGYLLARQNPRGF